jgi:hypothetical protein
MCGQRQGLRRTALAWLGGSLSPTQSARNLGLSDKTPRFRRYRPAHADAGSRSVCRAKVTCGETSWVQAGCKLGASWVQAGCKLRGGGARAGAGWADARTAPEIVPKMYRTSLDGRWSLGTVRAPNGMASRVRSEVVQCGDSHRGSTKPLPSSGVSGSGLSRRTLFEVAVERGGQLRSSERDTPTRSVAAPEHR